MDLFVGFTSTTIPGVDQYLKDPVPPSNYKTAEAIESHRLKTRETQMREAIFTAGTSRLIALTVLDSYGKAKAVFRGDKTAKLFHEFLTSLLVFPCYIAETFTPSVRIWGFDVKQMFKIAAYEIMKNEVDPPALRFWYHNNAAYDPYEVLTGEQERKMFDIGALADFFHIASNRADPLENTANVARLLCLKTGMVVPDRSSLEYLAT